MKFLFSSANIRNTSCKSVECHLLKCWVSPVRSVECRVKGGYAVTLTEPSSQLLLFFRNPHRSFWIRKRMSAKFLLTSWRLLELHLIHFSTSHIHTHSFAKTMLTRKQSWRRTNTKSSILRNYMVRILSWCTPFLLFCNLNPLLCGRMSTHDHELSLRLCIPHRSPAVPPMLLQRALCGCGSGPVRTMSWSEQHWPLPGCLLNATESGLVFSFALALFLIVKSWIDLLYGLTRRRSSNLDAMLERKLKTINLCMNLRRRGRRLPFCTSRILSKCLPRIPSAQKPRVKMNQLPATSYDANTHGTMRVCCRPPF